MFTAIKTRVLHSKQHCYINNQKLKHMYCSIYKLEKFRKLIFSLLQNDKKIKVVEDRVISNKCKKTDHTRKDKLHGVNLLYIQNFM